MLRRTLQRKEVIKEGEFVIPGKKNKQQAVSTEKK